MEEKENDPKENMSSTHQLFIFIFSNTWVLMMMASGKDKLSLQLVCVLTFKNIQYTGVTLFL